MDKNDISTLVRYNFWANDRILATCKNITADQFTNEVSPDPGWGSLRGILVHMLDAEFGWRTVLQAMDTDVILEASDFENVEELSTRWKVERTAWLDFIASLSDESLGQGYGKDPQNSAKVWQTIMHVVMHGIQHRSEAASILTGYGHSPGELDFDVFLQEDPGINPDGKALNRFVPR